MMLTGKTALVRPKPTAYGRATLGAKPFRRAPLQQHDVE